MLSLSVYAVLTAHTIASTYHVSSNPNTDYTCTDGSNGICNIHCDKVGEYTQLETSFDCGDAKECYFYCEERRCAQNSHIIATNSSNFHIILGSNGEECMNGAVIQTPKYGNATFEMGDSKKGFAGMTVYAGANTQNIIITAESNNIVGDDCKGMQIYTATAKYVEISLGNGIKWENGVLECPAITDRYNEATNMTPCVLYASNAILMNTHIVANNGIPENIWISPGVIYMGINTLTCDGTTSIAPFDMNSECWFHPLTTFYPSPTHLIKLTAIIADTTISDMDSVDQQTTTFRISDEDFFTSYTSITSVIFVVLLFLFCSCSCLLCYFIHRAYRARQLHTQMFGKADISSKKANQIHIELPSKSTPMSPSGNSNTNTNTNSNNGQDTYTSSPSSIRPKPSVLSPTSVAYPNMNSEWIMHMHMYQQKQMMDRNHSWHFHTAPAMHPFFAHYNNSQSCNNIHNIQNIPTMHPFYAYYNSQSYNNIYANANSIPLAPSLLPPPPPPTQTPSQPANNVPPPPPPPPRVPPPPPPLLPLPLSVSDTSYNTDTDFEYIKFSNVIVMEQEAEECDEKNKTKNKLMKADSNVLVKICDDDGKELEYNDDVRTCGDENDDGELTHFSNKSV